MERTRVLSGYMAMTGLAQRILCVATVHGAPETVDGGVRAMRRGVEGRSRPKINAESREEKGIGKTYTTPKAKKVRANAPVREENIS